MVVHERNFVWQIKTKPLVTPKLGEVVKKVTTLVFLTFAQPGIFFKNTFEKPDKSN